MDIFDKNTRSRMMSGIRSKDTKPEVLTRKALHSLGYRYRLGSKIGRIRPDIVLRSRRVAIFIHGCYWHQHDGCRLAYSDRKYSDNWKKKFRDNIRRDQRVVDQLLADGWKVAVLWECVTRNPTEFEKAIRGLNAFIEAGSQDYFETQYRQI